MVAWFTPEDIAGHIWPTAEDAEDAEKANAAIAAELRQSITDHDLWLYAEGIGDPVVPEMYRRR
jgi:hypothetical protein